MKQQDILMIHGADYKDMTKRLLETSDLTDMIGNKKAKIALKPNLATDNNLRTVFNPYRNEFFDDEGYIFRDDAPAV